MQSSIAMEINAGVVESKSAATNGNGVLHETEHCTWNGAFNVRTNNEMLEVGCTLFELNQEEMDVLKDLVSLCEVVLRC